MDMTHPIHASREKSRSQTDYCVDNVTGRHHIVESRPIAWTNVHYQRVQQPLQQLRVVGPILLSIGSPSWICDIRNMSGPFLHPITACRRALDQLDTALSDTMHRWVVVVWSRGSRGTLARDYAGYIQARGIRDIGWRTEYSVNPESAQNVQLYSLVQKMIKRSKGINCPIQVQ